MTSRLYSYLANNGISTSYAIYFIGLIAYFIPLCIHSTWSRDEMDPFSKEEAAKAKQQVAAALPKAKASP